jgi:hypothetical protein
MLHMDVAKVDWDVTYVASVSNECCKHLFKIFHLFQAYVCKRFNLDIAYVSHICCKSMFQIFQCCSKCFHVASYKCLCRSCICCNG